MRAKEPPARELSLGHKKVEPVGNLGHQAGEALQEPKDEKQF